MQTLDIRKKLHQFIDIIEDKKAIAIYTLFEDDMDTDALRNKLIKAERNKHSNGEGNSFSWDEVKQMAMHKELRHDL
jgi:hypothetical protein